MLEWLDEGFKRKIELLREKCAEAGIGIRFKRGFVNVFEHAELWRSCHNSSEIDVAIAELQRKGCQFLAATMMHSHAMHLNQNLKRCPGFSWHNFGKAIDVEIVDRTGKKLHHDLREPLFCMFMDIAEDCDLHMNHDACDFDGFHLQSEKESSPGDVYAPEVIDNEIYRSYRDGHY